ncbi:hypothetical protein SUGI_0986920 [Cryptomeria japonica]|nr:hypothetical protein SUGI_0986920 [Cryptomeria japonica]
MATTMLNEANIPDTYWKEVIHIVVYTLNWVHLRVNSKMNLYELWYDRKPSLKYFRVFGSKCFIKRYADGLGSFQPWSDEGIFLGYSTNSKAYKFYNNRLRKMVESINVRIDEDLYKGKSALTPYIDDSDVEYEEQFDNGLVEESPRKKTNRYVQKNHLEEQIIGDTNEGVQMKRRLAQNN